MKIILHLSLLVALTQLFYLAESGPVGKSDESTKATVITGTPASPETTVKTSDAAKRAINRRQAGQWGGNQPYNYNYGGQGSNQNAGAGAGSFPAGAISGSGQVIPPGFVPYIPPNQASSSNSPPSLPGQFGNGGQNQFSFGNNNGNNNGGQFGANQFAPQPSNQNSPQFGQNNQYGGVNGQYGSQSNSFQASTPSPFRQFPQGLGSGSSGQNVPGNNGFGQPPSNQNGFNNQHQPPQFNQRQPPSNVNGFNQQRQPSGSNGFAGQPEQPKTTPATPSSNNPGRNYYFYDPYYNPMQQTPDYGSFRTTTLNTLLMYTPAYTTQGIHSEMNNNNHQHNPAYNNGYGWNNNNNGYGNNGWNNNNGYGNNGYGNNNNGYGNNGWTNGNGGYGNWNGHDYYNNQNKQNMPQPINYNSQGSLPGSGSSYGLYNYYGATTASPSIPLMTVANVADTYSKSFNPYYGMTTMTTPSTPQNLWYSRYADLNYPIAAVPDSNYRNWKK